MKSLCFWNSAPEKKSWSPRSAVLALGLAGSLGAAMAPARAASQPADTRPQPTRLVRFKQVGDVTLRLHVFEPAGLESTDRRAAMVFFFGGGWVGGSPSQFYPHCAHLAERGVVAMAAEYRVRSRHGTTPYECVQDGKSALRWVRAHAAELGIDPNRIAAGGGSAGGQVAAATATVKGFDEPGEDTSVSARPNALVLFNPVFDNGPGGWGHERVKDRWQEFSPLHNLHRGVPPAIVFLGRQDKLVPVATAERWRDRMKELGVRCELRLYEGQGHGFFNFGRDGNRWYEATVKEMDDFLASLGWFDAPVTTLRPPLETGWEKVPREGRLRAYWWWLNGNVTREAITRDLEAMRAMGWGGALICDADGSSQEGNERAPHGPDFFSPQWRELYRHALKEAARLGLELSLNIQSGWNLGGPMVPPADAPKQLTWSSRRVEGPGPVEVRLPPPPAREGWYRDLFVLACPLSAGATPDPRYEGLGASSAQGSHPAQAALDGDPDTFWVSNTNTSETGPSPDRPQWLELRFRKPVSAGRLVVHPRRQYGPRAGRVEVSAEGETFTRAATFGTDDTSRPLEIDLNGASGRVFRIVFTGAFDPRSPQAPRNVQVAGLQLFDTGGRPLLGSLQQPLLNLEQKALRRALHFSAPDTTPLLEQLPGTPGEEDGPASAVVDLTGRMQPDGALRWEAPAGRWEILRFGCTLNDHCHVSTCSEGWEGYAIDPFDAGAFTRYWDAVVEPLIADAGPLAGTTLKYLHTDSWEVEVANWTPTLREEFRRRRGYDPLPWLPVVAGRLLDSRDASNRFLNDLRRTMGDLAIDHHYRLFKERAHRHGLRIHPESGGPHAVPIDAQQCLGFDDAPMSEFWAWSWRHRIGDANRFFVKQPASAAHVYGHRLVLAEGFTTIGPHWQETLWDNLKPAFDQACCEGLNRLVWHAFVCSPAAMGVPGQQYFAGTHVNPNVTWWSRGRPFFDYLNRCQWMLQQGRFVADVAYYYGDHVPNFAQYKATDPAGVRPGYDYDVLTAEAILERLRVRNGRLVLPDGMSYRLLVLPQREAIALPVLRRLQELVQAGAVVIGPRPVKATSLQGYPQCDAEVRSIAAELWDAPQGQPRVTGDRSPVQVLRDLGVTPDFQCRPLDPEQAARRLDWIHRRLDATDIYFVANRTNQPARFLCTFRVRDRAPELWDPVSGRRRFAAAYTPTATGVTLPLDFSACGSWFVVFREPAAAHPPTGDRNTPKFRPLRELAGPWQVRFDPAWGGPAAVEFPELTSWTERPEPGVRHYSGTATYAKTFEWSADAAPPATAGSVWLDLGELRELAEVRLNGRPLGIVWTPPFRVEITDALRPGENRLEVDVVNFWPNRIIGDDALPPAERRTRTNIRKLTAGTRLTPSGLFGPVRLVQPASGGSR